MKKLLVRELVEAGGAGPVKVLSIFVVDEDLGEDQFDSELSVVLSKNNLFERLHVVGLIEHLRKVQVWLQEGRVPGDRIRKVLRDFSSEVCYVAFDTFSGTHKVLDYQLKIAEPPAHKWLDAERRAALLYAFDESDGMMCAPRGFHYRKTSSAHSTRFLRTANVLGISRASCVSCILASSDHVEKGCRSGSRRYVWDLLGCAPRGSYRSQPQEGQCRTSDLVAPLF